MKDTDASKDAFDAETHTPREKLIHLDEDPASHRKRKPPETNALLDVIRQVQAEFIADVDTQTLFDRLLHHLLAITESEHGFIGEILHTTDEKPYLKTHAITNIAWNAGTRRFYEVNAPSAWSFTTLRRSSEP